MENKQQPLLPKGSDSKKRHILSDDSVLLLDTVIRNQRYNQKRLEDTFHDEMKLLRYDNEKLRDDNEKLRDDNEKLREENIQKAYTEKGKRIKQKIQYTMIIRNWLMKFKN